MCVYVCTSRMNERGTKNVSSTASRKRFVLTLVLSFLFFSFFLFFFLPPFFSPFNAHDDTRIWYKDGIANGINRSVIRFAVNHRAFSKFEKFESLFESISTQWRGSTNVQKYIDTLSNKFSDPMTGNPWLTTKVITLTFWKLFSATPTCVQTPIGWFRIPATLRPAARWWTVKIKIYATNTLVAKKHDRNSLTNKQRIDRKRPTFHRVVSLEQLIPIQSSHSCINV